MLSWVFLGDRAEIKRKSGAVNHDGKNHGSLHLMSMPCNTSNSSWISRSLQWKKTTANANLTDIGFPPKKKRPYMVPKRGENPHACQSFRDVCPFFSGECFLKALGSKGSVWKSNSTSLAPDIKRKVEQRGHPPLPWQSWLQWANRVQC